MELFFAPKQAYQNAVDISTDLINPEEFDVTLILEWIKLFKIDLEQFYNQDEGIVIFNVVDYYISFKFDIYEDGLNITDIDCTDDRMNKNALIEYFKENNNHLHIN